MNSTIQTTFFGDSFQSTKTNKRQFLEKMDSLIPWQDWVSIITPIYYEGKVGQKPYPIELMLRIHMCNYHQIVERGQRLTPHPFEDRLRSVESAYVLDLGYPESVRLDKRFYIGVGRSHIDRRNSR